MSSGKSKVDSSGRPVVCWVKNGRGPRIYREKRGEVYEEEWTLRHMIAGKYYKFKLGSELRKAENKAWDIEARLQAGESPETIARQTRFGGDLPASGSIPTLGQVIAALKELAPAMELKTRTVKNYERALLMVARVVSRGDRVKRSRKGLSRKLKDGESGQNLPLTIFAGNAGTEFKSAMIKGVHGVQALKRAKRTANSYLRNAQAVFGENAKRHHPHFNGECIKEFLDEPLFRKVENKHRMPPESVIERVLTDGPKELRQDPNVYVAYLLALHSGLRKAEIANAKRGWISDTQPYRVWIREEEDYSPKSGEDGFAEISEWARAEILKYAKGVKYLLEGDDTERKECVFDRLNAWLRSKGITALRPTHELRALYGSFIATTKGLFVAQKFLRHKDAQVTSDCYADVVVSENLKQLWQGRAA